MASAVPFDFGRVALAAPSIRRSVSISTPGDASEREADDVADRVMRMVEPAPVTSAPPLVQRQCAECEEEERDQETAAAQLAPLPALQSIEGGEEETPLPEELSVQRMGEPGGGLAATSPAVVGRLAGAQSGGEPLPSGTRHSMEAAFGRDFSRVRVHRDSEAAELSHELSALAFTRGNHIYFGHGRYDPEASPGKRLLAHELTHVAQQGEAALKSGGGGAASVQASPPAIQRAANWAAANVHQTNNLANTALNGAPAGVTLPTLNGALALALNAPTINVAPVAAGGFDATVTAVAANTGSVDETVLSAGPWRLAVPKATIRANFPTLAQCTGAGNSTFRARGNPSDAAMAAANRRHEDHHAADGQAAFNATIVPWDTNLTAANAAGTTFHGATDAAARAALHTAMGGTPLQVTNAFVTAWNAAIPVFHATPAGGPVGAPTDPNAAPDCSWSFARYTNPS